MTALEQLLRMAESRDQSGPDYRDAREMARLAHIVREQEAAK